MALTRFIWNPPGLGQGHLGFNKSACWSIFWVRVSFNSLVVLAWLIPFLVGIGCSILYLFPASHHPIIDNFGNPNSTINVTASQCNVFEGKWIKDESYPLYDASECPFAERGFNCLANGRRDRDYLKYRWKPNNCDIPRFNVYSVLEHLRGKRVVFVGDSLGRTQWESMICMLMTGVEDKRSVYEVNGNKITKQIRFLGVRFSSYNFSVEFYRSVFLVQPGLVPRRAPKRVKMTLKLDKLDNIRGEWINSDVLIFNSGHWWTPGKLFEMGCYFQLGGSLKLGMSITSAFRMALNNWASWAERTINPSRTHVFFRTFESSHWRHCDKIGFSCCGLADFNDDAYFCACSRTKISCKVTRHPLSKVRGGDHSAISDAVKKVVKNMTLPVSVLHVTTMGAFRSDAHVGTWSDNPSVPDCSHWCLPGVPDTWNEVLFSYLLSKNKFPLQET